MSIRDQVLERFKDRLSQLQAQAGMALVAAEVGEIESVHEHLGEVHVQLSAVMHILWHHRELMAEEKE